MECRELFGELVTDKCLLSNVDVDPSCSAFIKNKLEVLAVEFEYNDLLSHIEKLKVCEEGFSAEYLSFDGATVQYKERRQKQKDIGLRINGFPNFDAPVAIYAIVKSTTNYYFGKLKTHNSTWQQHNNKPHTLSSSLPSVVAKSLVAIASKGDKSLKLFDACCGVGTVLLEACVADFCIEGCDINSKTSDYAKRNLAYYGYDAAVYTSDVKDILKSYDAVIIDLPYNLFSHADDSIILNILKSSARLSKRLVIVSTADITKYIEAIGFNINDQCLVGKRGYSKFCRTIWVCEKR